MLLYFNVNSSRSGHKAVGTESPQLLKNETYANIEFHANSANRAISPEFFPTD